MAGSSFFMHWLVFFGLLSLLIIGGLMVKNIPEFTNKSFDT